MKKGFYCDKDGEILLITENESNNSGVKSNNSQCIDCIHSEICQFYKTLGANVICYPCGFYEMKEVIANSATTKEKKIEEMRAILCRSGAINHCEYCEDCEGIVEALYNAGYRKQSEGEWIWSESGQEDYEQYWVCSCCHEKDYFEEKFCPNCGAKMKGGE